MIESNKPQKGFIFASRVDGRYTDKGFVDVLLDDEEEIRIELIGGGVIEEFVFEMEQD